MPANVHSFHSGPAKNAAIAISMYADVADVMHEAGYAPCCASDGVWYFIKRPIQQVNRDLQNFAAAAVSSSAAHLPSAPPMETPEPPDPEYDNEGNGLPTYEEAILLH